MTADYRPLRRWTQWGAALLVLLVGLLAYWPTLSFNFFWEDPFDIGQVEPFSYWQVLTVSNSNSYYRPLALFILKFLKFGGETYVAWPYHLFVVTGHVLSGVILYGLAGFLFSRSDKSRLFPLAAGLTYALYPLPYEATARASSMHEWLTAAMFASFWLYAWGRITRRRWPFAVALIMMSLAQLLHENGLLFPALVIALEGWLLWQRRIKRWSPVVLLFAAAALLFFIIWLTIPKGGEAPQVGLHLREALYLSQGISFPFAGPIVWLGGLGLSAEWQAGVALVLAIATLLFVHGRARFPRLALALTWWGIAISLAWLARPIEYLQVSPRVMYFPSFGAALAWAGVVDLGRGRRLRALGIVLLSAVLIGNSYVLARSTALYKAGSDLMGQVVNAGTSGGRILFVNVPDRFAFRDPFYPLGYWGMLLAPVSQDLSDFISFTTGKQAETLSLSDFQLLSQQADLSPYLINTRGVDAFASELMYESVLWADSTYLTSYDHSGVVSISEVGTISESTSAFPAVADFADKVSLTKATAELLDSDTIAVRLTWHAETHPAPNDTIFVHLLDEGGELIAQADGDSLAGLIPPSAWRNDNIIRDQRAFQFEEALAPGMYSIQVGLYNRVDGNRYIVMEAAGNQFISDAAQVATIIIPARES